MNITLNVPALLFKSLVEAVVQLADDYRAVNSERIEVYRTRQELARNTGNGKGSVFYQSDRKLHEQELRERQQKELETGGY